MDDRNDTTTCPLGHRCEACGAESPRLAVVTRAVFGATLCLTMCSRCAAPGTLPPIMLSTAERLVQQHREHGRPVQLRRVLPRDIGGESAG